MTDSIAALRHAGQPVPVRVIAIVLDCAWPSNHVLHITVDLHEAVMRVAAVDDRLVCA